jgi:hypothetical protein
MGKGELRRLRFPLTPGGGVFNRAPLPAFFHAMKMKWPASVFRGGALTGR